MSDLCTNLLNNVYRIDPFFMKLKEVYDKWKNYNNNENKILNNQRDIIFLRFSADFTRYPNILINQLLEINFGCKECFKMFLLIYKITLLKNNMCFKCKKEYLRKVVKLNRMTLERCFKELEEKNMLLIEKDDGDFTFTLNLCFLSWNLPEKEKDVIKENVEKEINRFQKKYIEEEVFFD